MIVELVVFDVAPASGGQTYLAYGKWTVPQPIETRTNVPEAWLRFICRETLSSVNTSSNDGGKLRINLPTAGNSIPVRVGDIIQWGPVPPSAVIRVNEQQGGVLNVTLDADYDNRINQPTDVAYINRQERLIPVVATCGDKTYQPILSGLPVNTGSIVDGDVYTAYYINVASFAQGCFERPQRPVMYDTDTPVAQSRVAITTSVRLVSGGEDEEFTIKVFNAVQPTLLGAQLNNQANGVNYTPYVIHKEYGRVAMPTMVYFADGYFTALTTPNACAPASASTKYVCWLTRYGAPQLYPFNWLNRETYEVEVLETARTGYDTRNVAVRTNETLELTTGFTTNILREWWEDLAASPYVFVADELVPLDLGGIVVANLDAMQWTEYRIMPGTHQMEQANNRMLNLTFELTKVGERVTYRN